MRTPLYWIDGPWAGRLAIMPRPRGGDWLEDEVSSWRKSGVDMVISTLTKEEIAELDLAQEAEWCQNFGLEFLLFPIPDRGVPSSFKNMAELVRSLESKLAAGKKIAIHCRQGIGRSALLAVCLLAGAGVAPEMAWERVRLARGCDVPDTLEQRDWVFRFAREWLTPLSL